MSAYNEDLFIHCLRYHERENGSRPSWGFFPYFRATRRETEPALHLRVCLHEKMEAYSLDTGPGLNESALHDPRNLPWASHNFTLCFMINEDLLGGHLTYPLYISWISFVVLITQYLHTSFPLHHRVATFGPAHVFLLLFDLTKPHLAYHSYRRPTHKRPHQQVYKRRIGGTCLTKKT